MAWGDDLSRLAVERGPALVGHAYLLTGDRDSARDRVQEALVRTYGRPALHREATQIIPPRHDLSSRPVTLAPSQTKCCPESLGARTGAAANGVPSAQLDER